MENRVAMGKKQEQMKVNEQDEEERGKFAELIMYFSLKHDNKAKVFGNILYCECS